MNVYSPGMAISQVLTHPCCGIQFVAVPGWRLSATFKSGGLPSTYLLSKSHTWSWHVFCMTVYGTDVKFKVVEVSLILGSKSTSCRAEPRCQRAHWWCPKIHSNWARTIFGQFKTFVFSMETTCYPNRK